MAARTRGINLLPKSEFELSFWGRFLHWAITSGRYIIITVEAIVIIAFLSRFKLDQDLADLTSAIEGQQRILQSQAAQEQQFREVQARIQTIQTVLASQLHDKQISDTVVSTLPPEIKLSSLIATPTDISLSGTTLSEDALGRMLVAMSRHSEWKGLDLTNLSAENESAITFSLVIKR